jgi:hypothetical protein
VAVILTTGIIPVETKDVEMTSGRVSECQASIGRVECIINIHWLAGIQGAWYAFAGLIEHAWYGYRAGQTVLLELNRL